MSKPTKKSIQKNNLLKYLPKRTDSIYMQLASSAVEKFKEPTVTHETDTVCPQTANDSHQASIVSDEKYIESQEKIAELELRCANLEAENKKLLNDNKCLKKLLNASKDLNLYNGIQLKKAILKEKTSENVEKMLFTKHESNFTPTQLKELRSIPAGIKKDSKFVSSALEVFYKDQLAQKCLDNSKKRQEGKKLITPEKKNNFEGNVGRTCGCRRSGSKCCDGAVRPIDPSHWRCNIQPATKAEECFEDRKYQLKSNGKLNLPLVQMFR